MNGDATDDAKDVGSNGNSTAGEEQRRNSTYSSVVAAEEEEEEEEERWALRVNCHFDSVINVRLL